MQAQSVVSQYGWGSEQAVIKGQVCGAIWKARRQIKTKYFISFILYN